MNRNMEPEFFVSLLVATLAYLFGFMLLKDCIDPIVVSAEVMGQIPSNLGTGILYGLFLCNMLSFMVVLAKTYDLFSVEKLEEEIFE